MKWIYKLERKYSRYAIENLMMYIVILQAVVYLTEMFIPQSNIYNKFMLYPSLVMQGQVWRLITFILLPPLSSPLMIVFALYFYYLAGTNLEYMWGSFKFNLYYLIGILATIAAALITGIPVTNVHLNLSLFLAYAYLFPNHQVLIFFILPIKLKYLAWIEWGFLAFTVIFSPWAGKLSALASVVNFFIFFGSDLFKTLKLRWQTYQNRRRFKRAFRR